jgi:hypothetical protein
MLDPDDQIWSLLESSSKFVFRCPGMSNVYSLRAWLTHIFTKVHKRAQGIHSHTRYYIGIRQSCAYARTRTLTHAYLHTYIRAHTQLIHTHAHSLTRHSYIHARAQHTHTLSLPLVHAYTHSHTATTHCCALQYRFSSPPICVDTPTRKSSKMYVVLTREETHEEADERPARGKRGSRATNALLSPRYSVRVDALHSSGGGTSEGEAVSSCSSATSFAVGPSSETETGPCTRSVSEKRKDKHVRKTHRRREKHSKDRDPRLSRAGDGRISIRGFFEANRDLQQVGEPEARDKRLRPERQRERQETHTHTSRDQRQRGRGRYMIGVLIPCLLASR